MSKVENLLKYQTEDEKLIKVERELSASPERKNLAQAVNFVTKANERLDALDGKARSLEALLDELKEKYAELSETLAEFENIDELLDGGADTSFYKKNLAQLSDRLKSLRQEVTALQKSVKESEEEFQSLYQKNREMQKQGKEYQAAYEALKAEKRKESEAIKGELARLAKDIDPQIMQKYQMKRSEHIFPVLCAVKNNRCSKCGTELSLVGTEKVNSGGAVECENCHRFLYKE